MARIAVTGAAGFIGRALCASLAARGHEVRALTRRPAPAIPGVAMHAVGDISERTDWPPHLTGVTVVIHLAGRAHAAARGADFAGEPEAATALARAAAASGVRRLVQISSVRAMAAATTPGRPLTETDPPHPADPYGRAKLAIERATSAAAREAGLELVILRPPLVYGPGVKANFRALLRLVASGLPLPFAALDNRRSLIFRDNLVDLLARAAVDPAAGGQVLLARDEADLSTPQLIRALAAGLGRQPRLFALPAAVWPPLAALPLLGPRVARLTESLAIDDAASRGILGWRPPIAANAALFATARAFRDRPW